MTRPATVAQFALALFLLDVVGVAVAATLYFWSQP